MYRIMYGRVQKSNRIEVATEKHAWAYSCYSSAHRSIWVYILWQKKKKKKMIRQDSNDNPRDSEPQFLQNCSRSCLLSFISCTELSASVQLCFSP